MTYQETVAYLFEATPVFEHTGGAAYKEGLSNTLALDGAFPPSPSCLQTIHVAGTNGKGSCLHTLAAILQQAGYKVGLYTSPHLVDFRERIRVNGEPPPTAGHRLRRSRTRCLSRFILLFLRAHDITRPTLLKEQAVDVAVIEVGLGGRLDCTNIITPEVSVITNISFDHTHFG